MAKYFTEDELKCKGTGCCDGLPPGGIHPQLMQLLDAIREKVGKPVHVLSGYRCPVHNAEVGGVPNSEHVAGQAADLYYEGLEGNVQAFGQLCRDTMRELGIEGGVGRYFGQCFVHVDVRGYEAKWEG